VQIADMTVVVR